MFQIKTLMAGQVTLQNGHSQAFDPYMRKIIF